MALFRHLNDESFMVFAGSNRRLYEECLLAVYRRFFAGTLATPSQSEVVACIYETLGRVPALWRDEDDRLLDLGDLVATGRRLRRMPVADAAQKPATDAALSRARHIYVRLNQTGWLEEEQFGLRVTVDMPMGPILLLEVLWRLKQGPASRLGGVVVQIRNALRACRQDPRLAALGLRQATETAEQFVQSLRATLSALKQVSQAVMASESLEQRLQTFFEDFIDGLLLKDFAAIHTVNHPYRFKGEILALVQELSHDSGGLAEIGRAYSEARLAGDLSAGRAEAQADLLALAQTFDRIDEMFQRVDGFRRQLEQKLRNTIRYAERGSQTRNEVLQGLLLRMDKLLERAPEKDGLPAMLVQPFLPWSHRAQTQPRSPRAPVATAVLRGPLDDPAFHSYKKMQRDYVARLNPTAEELLGFVARQFKLAGNPDALHANTVHLGDIDDFLAFEALRRAVGQPDARLAGALLLEPALGSRPHDSEWILCADFTIRRLSAAPRRKTA